MNPATSELRNPTSSSDLTLSGCAGGIGCVGRIKSGTLPTILAAFYRNDLDTTLGDLNRDWAHIIHPKEGGGRTTSVSIMKRNGVKKMGQGWLVLPCNSEILKTLTNVFDIRL